MGFSLCSTDMSDQETNGTLHDGGIRNVLERSYKIHDIGITSVAKINKKVTYVLGLLAPQRIGVKDRSHTKSIDTDQLADERPILIQLCAKAPTASKLITIVEVVRRELEARRVEPGVTKLGEPSLWQYARVHGEIAPVRSKELGGRKDTSNQKRKREVNDSGAPGSVVKRTKRIPANTTASVVGDSIEATQDSGSRSAKDGLEVEAEGIEAAVREAIIEDDEEFFERFRQTPGAKAVGVKDPKIRAVPILTIWLCIQAVPELAVIFDESP